MKLPADVELEEILERGDLDGVFFLFGDADRLRDDAARRLADAAVGQGARDFNLDAFRGGSVEPEELASALSTPPMMAGRRVVLLLDAQELKGRGRDVVTSALDDPPDGLAFVVAARIPDRSKAALYSALKEKARALEWSAPKEQEIPGWLVERAEQAYGFRLETDAAQAMAAAVGEDLSVLDAELEKLSSAAGEGVVDRDRVAELVPNVRDVDRWDWLDRVADRSYESALADLPRLLAESRESAVGLLIAMIDHHIYLGLSLEGGRDLTAEVLRASGKGYLARWKPRIYARQARAWSRPELERALGLMRRADRQAKSGAGDRGVLEELLLSLSLLRREAA